MERLQTSLPDLSLAPRRQPVLLSIVFPLYNEEGLVSELRRRLTLAVAELGCPVELVAVDDGSADRTRALLAEWAAEDSSLRVVCLSRNFGLQAAVQAGLAHATGDAIVLMDGDLQDPPELISQLLQAWRDGAEVVFTTKRSRTERGLRRLALDSFHRIYQRMADIPLPLGAGNFSLMDRRALEAVQQLPEHNRYLPGLRCWVGFRQVEIVFDRDERAAGKPQMTFRRLLRLAFDGIFGFSHLPLKVATLIGLLACGLGVVLVGWVMVERFITHTAILGWPSLMIAVCLIGGAQLVCIGILGEYIARIYDEVRRRPPFLVREVLHQPRKPDHLLSETKL